MILDVKHSGRGDADSFNLYCSTISGEWGGAPFGYVLIESEFLHLISRTSFENFMPVLLGSFRVAYILIL